MTNAPSLLTRISAIASALAVVTLVAATAAAQRGQSTAPPSGTLMGQVQFVGTPPRPQRVRMTSDPLCMPGEKGDQSETLLVGKDGGIQNVFVYVKDGLGSKKFPVPTTPARLDQKGCRFVPHVFGVQAGQPIAISNSDPAVHNVDAKPKLNSQINLMQLKGSKPQTRSFATPEVMVPIRCDVHGWMTSWVGVLAHPFFAVTSADGRYTIKGLPPGTYTIEAWHETLGRQTQKITIVAGKAAAAAFSFKK